MQDRPATHPPTLPHPDPDRAHRLPRRVDALFVYPLKGARGIALPRARVTPLGLEHDRRLMLVADGRFLTQRAHPELALVTPRLHLEDDTTGRAHAELSLAIPGHGECVVDLTSLYRDRSSPRTAVTIWKDTVPAIIVPGDASRRFSDYLGRACTLVAMPDDTVRAVEVLPDRSPVAGARVSFADGYPLLLTTTASLDDLNARLLASGEAAVPMNRFRPNVVIGGSGTPFEEDASSEVVFHGDLVFRMPKRCSRCEVITIDQATAIASKEPLRTLASYRTEANKVSFGQNLVPDLARSVVDANGELHLHVGDEASFAEPDAA